MVTRRRFTGLLAGALAAGARAEEAPAPRAARGPFLFGACRPLRDGALMKELGYGFIEQGVQGFLEPGKSDAEFAARGLKAARECPLPVRSCNSFLPGAWPLTGPEERLQWEPALKFADVAFRRADEVGVQYIVFGSSAARRAPEGFPAEKARDQFVAFARRLADLLEKGNRRVTVLLEPLRAAECNIFNTVEQGYGLVARVGSPRVRLLADIYHMRQGGEPAETLARARGVVLHCHVATHANRLAPGLEPDDCGPYLKALAAAGYAGGVSVESGWGKGDLRAALAGARATLGAWAGEEA